MKVAATFFVAVFFASAVASFAQYTESCKGDCPEGYLSVCVERGDDCKCRCARNVDAGADMLTDLLREAGVSAQTVEKGIQTYRELVSRTGGKFSFELYDYDGTMYTVSGTGEPGVVY